MHAASSTRTALLLIDIQKAFFHPTYFGTSRSTPDCEENVTCLVGAARAYNEWIKRSPSLQTVEDDGREVLIVHVHHHSINPASPLFPGNEVEEPSVDGRTRKVVLGVEPMDYAKPVGRSGEEPVFTKSVNSAFIGTGLEALLRARRIRQLLICGLTTEHCVSTSVRMAGNLGVVDGAQVNERGLVVLVGDACAAYEKPGFSADVVHRVQIECLRGEFADVEDTHAVVDAVFSCKEE